MDLTSFLLGITAAATLAGTLVALIAYVRGRAKVVVELVAHDFALPPGLNNLLDPLEPENLFELMRGLEHIESPDPHVQVCLRNFSKLRNDYPLGILKEHAVPRVMWTLTITNNGYEPAEELEIQIPNAKAISLELTDKATEVINGSILRIPKLRPRETVTARAWGEKWGLDGEPRLLQARGRAVVRKKVLVPSRVASVYEVWTSVRWIILIMLLSVLVGVLVELALS